MSEKRLFNSKEAMEYLSIKSDRTLRSLVKENKLKSVIFDRHLRFDKQDLDQFIEDQKKTQ